jgi:HEAT repeat protein
MVPASSAAKSEMGKRKELCGVSLLALRALRAVWAAALLGLGLCGCASQIDDLKNKDLTFKQFFQAAPPPLVVLHDPNTAKDGETRAKALARLEEPLRNQGSQKDQDEVIDILKTAATTDQTPLCRLAALRTLGHFKDPRVADIVETAYLEKLAFSQDINNSIRQQCLSALIETGGPIAEKRLLLVAKEPPSTGSEQERLEVLDRRLLAIKGLGNYKDQEAAATLVQVLRSEKDVAMRDQALEALEQCTGKKLPADSPQWNAYAPPPPKDVNLATTATQPAAIVPVSAVTPTPPGNPPLPQ